MFALPMARPEATALEFQRFAGCIFNPDQTP
jgi:hypothetical protein